MPDLVAATYAELAELAAMDCTLEEQVPEILFNYDITICSWNRIACLKAHRGISDLLDLDFIQEVESMNLYTPEPLPHWLSRTCEIDSTTESKVQMDLPHPPGLHGHYGRNGAGNHDF
jgi:hypothetical protein